MQLWHASGQLNHVRRTDLRAFHDRVLGHGQLPLDLLEKSIKEWGREQLPPRCPGRFRDSQAGLKCELACPGAQHDSTASPPKDRHRYRSQSRRWGRPMSGGPSARRPAPHVVVALAAVQAKVAPRTSPTEVPRAAHVQTALCTTAQARPAPPGTRPLAAHVQRATGARPVPGPAAAPAMPVQPELASPSPRSPAPAPRRSVIIQRAQKRFKFANLQYNAYLQGLQSGSRQALQPEEESEFHGRAVGVLWRL